MTALLVVLLILAKIQLKTDNLKTKFEKICFKIYI